MGSNFNILTSLQNSQLFAIQKTSRVLDAAQTRLASGLRVASPIDNPQNFFTSFSLSSQASDLNRVLDSIGKSILNIQSAETSNNTLKNFVSQAQAVTQDAKADLQSNAQDIGALILADNPVVYYRLNEESGTTATNLGSGGSGLDGTYSGGVSLNSGSLTFSLDNRSVRFDGNNDRVDIPNSALINTSGAGYPERSVELTFQADNLTGRQVLFEEGGTGNAIALYLDNDRVYYAVRDAGDFGPFDISAEVEAGKTYQAAFVLDSNAGTFTGYLNGEAVGTGVVTKPLNAHGGAVAIGRNAGGTYFHDGANGGNGEYFQGRIADFALYNSVLTQSDLQTRYDATQFDQAKFYQDEVTKLINGIDDVVADSTFNGFNLLNSDTVWTSFNPNGSSSLLTEGVDLTSSGLGFGSVDFSSYIQLDKTLFEFDDADKKIEAFGNSLSNDLAIINTKKDYIQNTINTHLAGSDDLTLADIDEEGANVLALQTQKQIQIETLGLSSKQTGLAQLLLKDPFPS